MANNEENFFLLFLVPHLSQINSKLKKTPIKSTIYHFCDPQVCCLWCSKSRQRKKERFERRNSIRLSKSSLAGSRSLASMNSTSFTDINYRRRLVAMSPNGTMGTNAGSKTGTINSRNGTYKSATRTSGQGSFDSLAMDKTLNSTVEDR